MAGQNPTNPVAIMLYQKDMYHRALAGFDRVLGRRNSETIDCGQSLGHIYVRQGNFLLAQALFYLLFEEQAEALGRTHDQTVRSLCALADVYRVHGKWIEAGQLIWRMSEDDEKA